MKAGNQNDEAKETNNKRPQSKLKIKKHLLIAIIITELGLIIRTFIIVLIVANYIVGMTLSAILGGFRDMSNYSNEQTPGALTWRKFDDSTYSEQCSLLKDYILTEYQADNQNDLSRDEIEIIKLRKDNDATIPFNKSNNAYYILVKIKEEYVYITIYTDNTIEENSADLEYLHKTHIITE